MPLLLLNSSSSRSLSHISVLLISLNVESVSINIYAWSYNWGRNSTSTLSLMPPPVLPFWSFIFRWRLADDIAVFRPLCLPECNKCQIEYTMTDVKWNICFVVDAFVRNGWHSGIIWKSDWKILWNMKYLIETNKFLPQRMMPFASMFMAITRHKCWHSANIFYQFDCCWSGLLRYYYYYIWIITILRILFERNSIQHILVHSFCCNKWRHMWLAD